MGDTTASDKDLWDDASKILIEHGVDLEALFERATGVMSWHGSEKKSSSRIEPDEI